MINQSFYFNNIIKHVNFKLNYSYIYNVIYKTNKNYLHKCVKMDKVCYFRNFVIFSKMKYKSKSKL